VDPDLDRDCAPVGLAQSRDTCHELSDGQRERILSHHQPEEVAEPRHEERPILPERAADERDEHEERHGAHGPLHPPRDGRDA
jgi:hypothetical protein